MTKVTKAKLSDLLQDDDNGNQGTIRGRKALTDSIQDHGFIEAGTLDKHGRIIGGNKRYEVVGDIDLSDEVDIIEIDGTRPVYLKATHLDLDTPEGRKAAWRLNRIHELSFEVDSLQLVADLEDGLDLSDLWDNHELADILNDVGDRLDPQDPANDPYAEWKGMPEFENKDAFGAIATIKVHFESQEDIRRFSEVAGQTVTKETKSIWYPKKENLNLKPYRAVDES